LALIVDEVFLDFAHGEPRHTSFASNSDVLTFTLSGLSKICGLPQMKLAWIALSGPEEKRNAARERLDVIADAYLSVSTPIQLAAPAMLQTRPDFQGQVLARTKTNLAELDRQLSLHKSCSRLACEGGWTAILRVPAMQSDEDLAVELLTKAQVHVHPGHFYDFAANGFLVVSLIVPPEIFAEGISRILRFF
jgi:aspartate/methionine/tyrosine aminotransferase